MRSSAPPRGVTAQESATDADLWRLALSEDPQAFGVIFDRHFVAIHRFCARRTGSAGHADDLVSIVFLEVQAVVKDGFYSFAQENDEAERTYEVTYENGGTRTITTP